MDKTEVRAVIKYLCKKKKKKRHDTQKNQWGHGTDTCWGLPLLCNFEIVSNRIQAEQEQHRRWLSIRLSENLNHWWTSWCHSPYGFGLRLNLNPDLNCCYFGNNNEVICAEEVFLEVQDAIFFHDEIVMLKHCWTKYIDVKVDYIEK